MISKSLRAKAISELMDDISLGMNEEGHDMPEEAFMAAAEKHLDDMIEASTEALKAGQKLPIIKEALMVQGISDSIAEELTVALSD